MTWLRATFPTVVPVYTLLILLLGAAYPFIKGTFNVIFSFLKILGVIVGFMLYFEAGLARLTAQKGLLFDKLSIMVALIVPIGSIFLAFLVGYVC